jgi:hypothetical protein
MKLFITNFKKELLYGDCHLTNEGHYLPFIGARIKVEILGLFWVTYKQHHFGGKKKSLCYKQFLL